MQAPPQPANTAGAVAVAVRLTTFPLEKPAVQVAPQSIPGGDEVTVPSPLLTTERLNVVGAVQVELGGDVLPRVHRHHAHGVGTGERAVSGPAGEVTASAPEMP